MDTADSFRRMDSLDEMESFVADPVVESTQPTFSDDSLSVAEVHPEDPFASPPPQPLGSDSRRRSQSQPADLASYIPQSHLIPSSMKIVSPLKDISRSKKLVSATELTLPLTIGSTPSPSLACLELA
jgi:hypothetical protein